MYNQNPTFAGMGSNPLMSPQHAIQPTPISMLQQYPAPGLGLPLHPPQDPLFVTQKFPTPQNSTSPPNQWNQPYSNLQFLDPVPVMSVQMSQLVVSQEKSQHTTPVRASTHPFLKYVIVYKSRILILNSTVTLINEGPIYYKDLILFSLTYT